MAASAVQPESAEEPEVSEEETEEVRRNLQATLSAFAPAREQEEVVPDGDPFAEDALPAGEDMEATRVLNLDDLQFGRNYSRE